jgi:hypothetical protein
VLADAREGSELRTEGEPTFMVAGTSKQMNIMYYAKHQVNVPTKQVITASPPKRRPAKPRLQLQTINEGSITDETMSALARIKSRLVSDGFSEFERRDSLLSDCSTILKPWQDS